MQAEKIINEEGSYNMKPLEKIGRLIRKERERKDISIEYLSANLHVGKEQIIALEAGREELLPEKVFIKALIRRISERLGLEPDILINEMNLESLVLDSKNPKIRKDFSIRNFFNPISSLFKRISRKVKSQDSYLESLVISGGEVTERVFVRPNGIRLRVKKRR